jgi:hypothetical protein
LILYKQPEVDINITDWTSRRTAEAANLATGTLGKLSATKHQ